MIETILQSRLVPVAVIDDSANAQTLAECLLESGINVIEVTLRTPAALESIKNIKREVPGMMVGAGTVLDHKQVPELIDAGVSFAITPGLNTAVIESCIKHDLLVMPGVMTPSEIELARSFQLDVLKFFPAEAAGGASTLRAFAGPYGHTGLRFIPTGGIKLSNMLDYLALSCVAAVGGSWFVASSLLEKKDFQGIRSLTMEAVEQVQKLDK